ncbi:hypothetical protein C7U92_27945 [Bradyrhizobium sp. WBOS7]|uniref:Uncharacterized protein n=1 Tax=Bradyrhizobium betae TaxID=244734 RepID=A0AAE9NAB4_9BRAD|nr:MULTISPECIES: hypothetical protein [Bradyrhizobium]MDD1574490.1 hypothetical protein [Bradyrhizobium sp. WBOS1]UUO35545.1 hypothetical protein DCK84_13890 [Bradyrhizobium sp. WBOS01]MDD1529633.1 hypothetical protein [Bradyrhizobium sp. WBOS2]MDD1580526.1 hypothetical protein [Bradyrhizobium sp. WBOS7]MDD1604211.1 hypothetical protein [Bradyrhizobium sp. WBOS16]
MLRKEMKHGFSGKDWESAKQEARSIMVERAKLRGMIAYSDLVRQIQSIRLEPHDPRLFHLLGEVSSEEDAAGRGMLTVVVVHKLGDMQPGPGFFELAKLLGRDTKNIEKCWVAELHRVHAVWSLPKK